MNLLLTPSQNSFEFNLTVIYGTECKKTLIHGLFVIKVKTKKNETTFLATVVT